MDTKQTILRQLASIDQMERGTLSVLRQTCKGPCCNFQRWDNGRHRSEYIPADQVAEVEANLARYREFQSLVDQYVEIISRQSAEQRRCGVKKKRPTKSSRSPRKPKSKT